MIRTKRVYDGFGADDGSRFLVDRVWPRGMSKQSVHLDAWVKEVAPSKELRGWYKHDPARWEEFERRYHAELDRHRESWQPILAAARKGNVTLLYSARDTQRNNAVALKHYLDGKLADSSPESEPVGGT